MGGRNEGPRIVGILKKLGFNPRHAGKLLKDGTGSIRGLHRWQRNTDGRYSLHEEVEGSLPGAG